MQFAVNVNGDRIGDGNEFTVELGKFV